MESPLWKPKIWLFLHHPQRRHFMLSSSPQGVFTITWLDQHSPLTLLVLFSLDQHLFKGVPWNTFLQLSARADLRSRCLANTKVKAVILSCGTSQLYFISVFQGGGGGISDMDAVFPQLLAMEPLYRALMEQSLGPTSLSKISSS